MTLIRLVYASKSRLVESRRRDEIGRIITSAQRINEMNRVTGFLMVTSHAFAQVLEGEIDHVVETYGRIRMDPRHDNVLLLAEETIAVRSFSDWSMGLAERDETTAFIFGLYGVTPESDLPEQPVEALLDLAGELSRQRA